MTWIYSPSHALSSTFLNNLVNEYVQDKYINGFEEDYNKTFVAYADAKQLKESFNAFQEAYSLLMKNYLYEFTNQDKQELFEVAYESLDQVHEELTSQNLDFDIKTATNMIMIDVFNSIDAHTTWMSAEDAKMFTDSISGKYEGIGIAFNFNRADNEIIVSRVFENSPAYAAGLMGGDRIFSINDEVITSNQSIESLVAKIKGVEGTWVKLGIKRAGFERAVEVMRGSYYVPSVTYKVFEDNYGYISINAFHSDSHTLFRNALISMNVNELKGLIVDVRNNPGGLLTTAVLITDTILGGEHILSIKGRNAKYNKDFISLKDNVVDETLPILVLVNSLSASGSEVLAGALLLNNRAKLMGDTTFGKWSVQSSFTLADGSIFNVTTQLFYAARNKTFQGIGISPNIHIQSDDMSAVFRENNYKNALKAKDVDTNIVAPEISVNINRCPVYDEDPVIGCAVLYLRYNEKEAFLSRLK